VFWGRLSCCAALVAAACGGSLEPDAIVGTWYLQNYNDSLVPGAAVFHSGTDTSVVVIDSVVLDLQAASRCQWLVDLADQPVSNSETCAWSLGAGPDDVQVTVNDVFTLRGSADADVLDLLDPNENHLVFGRDPPLPRPDQPGATARGSGGGGRGKGAG
jgi:hypothetical protein